MKKFLFIFAAVLMFGLSMSARDVITRNADELPVPARSVIKDNFKSKISLIKIDKGVLGVSEYEVILADGSEITFDKSGSWKEVEVPAGKKVPDYFVPKAILDYIKHNNKGQKVVGIEKNRSAYEIQLANGVEMKFDRAGNFLRYDD